MNLKIDGLAILFVVLWMIPLFYEPGLHRYAWEELRVLIVGFLLGYLYKMLKNKEVR